MEKDQKKRKDVYDEFIAKTRYIIPIVEQRFLSIKEICREIGDSYGLDPISSYLEQEDISYDQLIEFVKSVGYKAKTHFREALIEDNDAVLERQPEYYYDFYFFRNKVYSDVDQNFSFIDPVNEAKKTLRNLDFELGKIHFDTEDRKKIPFTYLLLCAHSL